MSAALATTEPAVAYAMSRCLAARVLDPDRRIGRHHLRRCGWCEYPTDELRAGVEAFNAWAAPTGRGYVSGRHEARAFGELPRDRQEALIVEAQAFPELPAPTPTPPPAEPIAAVTATHEPEEENVWR